MKTRILFIFVVVLSFSNGLMAQFNSVKYFGQFYSYAINEMEGIRQTLTYSHRLSNKISIEGQIFTGTGRGKDISNNFQKDFALITNENYNNLPSFFIGNAVIYEGIYSYKRISNGLKQDNGWGLSLNFLLIDKSKLTFDISIGYLSLETKSILRDNIIDLRVTSNFNSEITDYQIIYPTSIHLKFRDGAGFTRLNASCRLANRISMGLNCNLNYSFWGTGLDYGGGLGFTYYLNTEVNE